MYRDIYGSYHAGGWTDGLNKMKHYRNNFLPYNYRTKRENMKISHISITNEYSKHIDTRQALINNIIK